MRRLSKSGRRPTAYDEQRGGSSSRGSRRASTAVTKTLATAAAPATARFLLLSVWLCCNLNNNMNANSVQALVLTSPPLNTRPLSPTRASTATCTSSLGLPLRRGAACEDTLKLHNSSSSFLGSNGNSNNPVSRNRTPRASRSGAGVAALTTMQQTASNWDEYFSGGGGGGGGGNQNRGSSDGRGSGGGRTAGRGRSGRSSGGRDGNQNSGYQSSGYQSSGRGRGAGRQSGGWQGRGGGGGGGDNYRGRSSWNDNDNGRRDSAGRTSYGGRAAAAGEGYGQRRDGGGRGGGRGGGDFEDRQRSPGRGGYSSYYNDDGGSGGGRGGGYQSRQYGGGGNSNRGQGRSRGGRGGGGRGGGRAVGASGLRRGPFSHEEDDGPGFNTDDFELVEEGSGADGRRDDYGDFTDDSSAYEKSRGADTVYGDDFGDDFKVLRPLLCTVLLLYCCTTARTTTTILLLLPYDSASDCEILYGTDTTTVCCTATVLSLKPRLFTRGDRSQGDV